MGVILENGWEVAEITYDGSGYIYRKGEYEIFIFEAKGNPLFTHRLTLKKGHRLLHENTPRNHEQAKDMVKEVMENHETYAHNKLYKPAVDFLADVGIKEAKKIKYSNRKK